MLIAIATEKGGVGKTTIATNFAAMRAAYTDSVKLIDTDNAKYANQWGMVRRAAGVTPDIRLAMMQGNIYSDLIAERDALDTVVVDVPAGDSVELRLACAAADVLIIPLSVGQFDTWSLGTMGVLVNELRQTRPALRVYSVLNKVPPSAKTELRDSVAMLAEMSDFFTPARTPIMDRMAFRSAARAGKGVTELDGAADQKAIAEITSLYEEVFNHG